MTGAVPCHEPEANEARSQPTTHRSNQSDNAVPCGYAALGWSASTWRLQIGLNNLPGITSTPAAPLSKQPLGLDDHFIKRPAATFFVTVEGGGIAEHGILAGDTLIVDRSRTPGAGSIIIAAIEGELTARPFAAIEGEDVQIWGVVSRGDAKPAMSVYGLADCNNFFVSCERVFRPALEGRPAVVLSSNDGCIVARSDEAKALSVKMAQPAFQAKGLIERHSIAVISGNLQPVRNR